MLVGKTVLGSELLVIETEPATIGIGFVNAVTIIFRYLHVIDPITSVEGVSDRFVKEVLQDVEVVGQSGDCSLRKLWNSLLIRPVIHVLFSCAPSEILDMVIALIVINVVNVRTWSSSRNEGFCDQSMLVTHDSSEFQDGITSLVSPFSANFLRDFIPNLMGILRFNFIFFIYVLPHLSWEKNHHAFEKLHRRVRAPFDKFYRLAKTPFVEVGGKTGG